MLTSDLYWQDKSWDTDPAVATLRWIRPNHLFSAVVAYIDSHLILTRLQVMYLVRFNLPALRDTNPPAFESLKGAKAYAYMTCLLTLKEIAHDAT